MNPMEVVESINDCWRETSYSGGGRPASRTELALRTFARIRSFIRPSLLPTVLTGFGTFGITAVQGIILARLLGPEKRGEFGSAILYTQSFTYIGLLGTQFILAQRAARTHVPELHRKLDHTAIRIGALTGSCTLAFVTFVAFATLPTAKQWIAPLCVLSAMALPFEHIRLLLLAIDQGANNFRRFNRITLATSLILPVLLIAMWVSKSSSVAIAVALTLIAPLTGLLLRLAATDYLRQLVGNPLPIGKVFKEARPFLFSSTICDLYSRIDQFLFLWLAGFAAQGLYAAAVPATTLLMVGTEAMALFSFNAGSRYSDRDSVRRLLFSGLMVASFQVALAALFAVCIGPLIILLYGARFVEAVPFALALIPGQAFNGFNVFVEGHLRGRGKVQIGIWARFAAAVLMVLSVALMWHLWGALSIPIAASTAHFLVAIVLSSYSIVDLHKERSFVVSTGSGGLH